MTEEEYQEQLKINSINTEKLYKKLKKYYGKVSTFEQDTIEIHDLANVSEQKLNKLSGLTESQILKKIYED